MYTINGNDPARIMLDGKEYCQWIIEKDGVEVARVFGPGSLGVALAAVETFTEKPNFFDGWTHRVQKWFKLERTA